MDYEEAKLQLLLHSGGATDAAGEPLVLEGGFIDSLRPYSGLHEKNFHLVMEALLTVGERIHRAPQLDRDLVEAAWWMCSTARAWGLHPGGMLQRNALISAEDCAKLERWVETFETTALYLLAGSPPHRAVYHYAAYVVGSGAWDNVAFFVDLMSRAVRDPTIAPEIETIAKALGKLGAAAVAALPALREAEQRSYAWYEPEERCTAETRAHVRQAIREIELSGGRG
ncbi:MAG: hypothetical protein QM820_09145 [Minicystis sp.]